MRSFGTAQPLAGLFPDSFAGVAHALAPLRVHARDHDFALQLTLHPHAHKRPH